MLRVLQFVKHRLFLINILSSGPIVIDETNFVKYNVSRDIRAYRMIFNTF